MSPPVPGPTASIAISRIDDDDDTPTGAAAGEEVHSFTLVSIVSIVTDFHVHMQSTDACYFPPFTLG